MALVGEWNGYPKMFTYSHAIEISRQYLRLLTDILGMCYRKKAVAHSNLINDIFVEKLL